MFYFNLKVWVEAPKTQTILGLYSYLPNFSDADLLHFAQREYKYCTAGLGDGHPSLEVSITGSDRMPMILIHKSMNNQILSSSSFPIASLHQTIHCCTYLQFHTLLNKLKSTSCTSLSIADRNITQIKPSVLTIKWIKDRLHFWGVM